MLRIFSLIMLGFGLILFYIFGMTLIGALDGGMYLFFEIILLIVWGLGGLLFFGLGFMMFKSDQKRRKQENE